MCAGKAFNNHRTAICDALIKIFVEERTPANVVENKVIAAVFGVTSMQPLMDIQADRSSGPAPGCSCCGCCGFAPRGGGSTAGCCCCQAWWQAQSLRNKWLCLSSVVLGAKQQASRPACRIGNQKSVPA